MQDNLFPSPSLYQDSGFQTKDCELCKKKIINELLLRFKSEYIVVRFYNRRKKKIKNDIYIFFTIAD